MYYDDELERYILDVPRECPKCGEPLEVDVNYGEGDNTYITKLICNNCDYELDVTNELKEVDEANGEDDLE